MGNALKLIAGIFALLFWFSSFALWKYYDAHRTTVAEPANGRIYRLNTHGSVVYLTSGEHNLLYGLMGAGILCFLLTAALHLAMVRHAGKP